MVEIAELIKNKKWGILGLTVLITVILFLIPLALNDMVSRTVSKNFEEGMKPVIEKIDNLDESMDKMDVALTKIIDDNNEKLLSDAMASYKKVKTIEMLNDSPLKKNTIARALRDKEIHEKLLIYDRDLTVLFYKYFYGENS